MRRFVLFTLIIASVILTSCISQKKVWLMQDQAKVTQSDFINPQTEAYKVKPGDRLFIKVYSSDKQTSKFFQTDLPNFMNSTYQFLNSYPIDQKGYLNFSFIEKIEVEGMTVYEVEKTIQEALREYFKDVTVVVKLVNFQVTVLGEVQNEGQYTITEENINILQAIALAGGILDFGNRRNVALIRQTKEGSKVHYIDLTDKRLLESEFYHILPGDIIYVQTYKVKSYAFDKLPYGIFMSTIALVVSLYSIFK